MTAKLTPDPASETPEGGFVGKPVRLPHLMLCGKGERWCGWKRTANTARQLAEMAAERRQHEAGCEGGLIIAGSGAW